MRSINAAVLLMALWLLMSGVYETLVIAFGIGSVALVVFVIRRMDRVDGDQLEIAISPIRTMGYFLWLLVEIAKANWAVAKIVLSPTMSTRQRLFRVRHSQRTDLAQAIFANSITLTPGTISVETEPGEFLVHAVDYAPETDAELANMNARVASLEKAGAT